MSTDSHKLLGPVIDEHLSWNLHIDEAYSKVMKRMNLLKAIKTYLPQCARKSFYKSLIQPALSQYMYNPSRDPWITETRGKNHS